jgi:hypothetical protein
VTLGRNIGPSPVGGNQFLLVKPAMLSGSDRPDEWGSELTCRIIGCYVPWFHQTEIALCTGMLQPGWPRSLAMLGTHGLSTRTHFKNSRHSVGTRHVNVVHGVKCILGKARIFAIELNSERH